MGRLWRFGAAELAFMLLLEVHAQALTADDLFDPVRVANYAAAEDDTFAYEWLFAERYLLGTDGQADDPAAVHS
jgi:hypothetical protein